MLFYLITCHDVCLDYLHVPDISVLAASHWPINSFLGRTSLFMFILIPAAVVPTFHLEFVPVPDY